MSSLSLKRTAPKVFVATTVMLTFITFWRAAAIVLSDLASSAYYVGGDTENIIGKTGPWFILAVMFFSYAVRALYIESSAMFVRGGVYRVVKESMGATLAKLSVSALMFDYVLTGPISAVAAGQYMAGFIQDLSRKLGHPVNLSFDLFAAFFAVAVTLYFWWKNIQGIHESSQKALRIMQITTVMVVLMLGWCLLTLSKVGVHWPPPPIPANMTWTHESLGWLKKSWVESSMLLALLVGFGHSVLAMSGEETLAQVYREIKSPKLKNLEKAGLLIFIYSLVFTGLFSLFAVMIIPDHIRPQYFGNLISGLSMYMVGPYNLKLAMQAFVVLVGVLILSGAVNTAIVGSTGVLNRVSEDGVLTEWFRRPHKRYGTSYRIVNLIVALQIITIVVSRGNVYFLAALYAFGVIWSFAFKALAVLVLRFTEPQGREWKVPGNLRIGGREIPVGLGLIALVLFSTATVNLFTKPHATVAGVGFSVAFFIVFTASERITHRRRMGRPENLDEFQVHGRPDVSPELMHVRPGNVLVAVRDPKRLHHLKHVLNRVDTTRQDVVVMSAHLYSGPVISAYDNLNEEQMFDHYQQELFSRVVAVAERAGKTVSLLIVPARNVFEAIVTTAERLRSSTIIAGRSNTLTAEEQGKLTGDAWERLPEPRPRITLEVVDPNGTESVFHLGPHVPRLRPEDLELMHNLWLEITSDPRLRSLHHYDVVALALKELQSELQGDRRRELIAMLVQAACPAAKPEAGTPQELREGSAEHRVAR